MPDRGRLLDLALKGLEAERARIDSEIAEIRRQFTGSTASFGDRGSMTPNRKRRKMSAEAKRRISEGMKRRYAELRSASEKPPMKQRRGAGLTAAGRRKLSEMMKARWAAKRKAAVKR
jgi:hypothetical protein